MPKEKSKNAQADRPGEKAPESAVALHENKGVPRSFLEYRRARSARSFLSKEPGGLSLTKLVNYLIQEHAKSKGWVCPDEFLDDLI